MKAVILAGGLGTRIAEETSSRPKPMVEVGGKPILWHIMKMYSAHGVNEFVICCGYKGYMIKEYFANYFLHMSDVTFDMANKNAMQVHQQHAEPWKITLIDTGENTLTGGRLKRVSQYLDEEDFCFTYGDGVGDINITDLIAFHKKHGKDDTIWERKPLEILAKEDQLQAFTHNGFWQPMDTLRDKHHLEELWSSGKAPWKAWD